MCFFFSLIPATVWLVIGFFVLFASNRAEGGLQKFGKILGIWAIIIASLFPIGGAYVSVTGICPMQAMVEQMQAPLAP
jgi:hypothetical protein